MYALHKVFVCLFVTRW